MNPVFTGVTISNITANVSTTNVDFIGTYSPTTIYESGTEKHNLYLGSDNTLYYPTASGFKVNTCRTYFRLNGLTAGDPAAGVRAFVLNFGDDGNAGIHARIHAIEAGEDARAPQGWYTLDGRRLNARPMQYATVPTEAERVDDVDI